MKGRMEGMIECVGGGEEGRTKIWAGVEGREDRVLG